MTAPTIYIVDRVVLKPGAARDFVDAYLGEYAPAASERGLTLDRVTLSPPLWLDDDSNTVTATWTVSGAQEWWKAAVTGRHDPGPARWWERMAGSVITRSRAMAADVADIEGLCDV